jgi:hypothetical protein
MVNPANLQRGVNYVAEGEYATAVAAREKVWLSADEWATIRAVVNGIANIPSNASRNILIGYQYALHRQGRRLQQVQWEIKIQHPSASAASKANREAQSNTSHTNAGGTQGKIHV